MRGYKDQIWDWEAIKIKYESYKDQIWEDIKIKYERL